MSDDDSVEFVYEDDDDDVGDDDGSGGGGDDSNDDELEKRNLFDMAMCEVSDDPKSALSTLRDLIAMEEDAPTQWSFKAQSEVFKLQLSLKKAENSVAEFAKVLKLATSASVDGKEAESVIMELVVIAGQNAALSFSAAQSTHNTAAEFFKNRNSDRLYFKVLVSSAEMLLQAQDWSHLSKLVRELRRMCQLPSGATDPNKGGELLRIYAIEIQMYTETKDTKNLTEVYELTRAINHVGVVHPRINGIIKECGGKNFMIQRRWIEARTDFFEAFKSYDEAGDLRKLNCLKYLVLSTMLSDSKFDPFDSQETSAYKTNSEIVLMTSLIDAYSSGDIKAFERILQRNRKSFMDDSFIAMYIDDLLHNIRTNVLIALINPYMSVQVSFLAKELNIGGDSVIDLLVDLILDRRIDAAIDQVRGLVILKASSESASNNRYAAVSKWSRSLKIVSTTLANKV